MENTDIYKLYRVVLEQTYPETWNNLDSTDEENGNENAYTENKCSISSQQPFTLAKHCGPNKTTTSCSLDFGQPDSWSNLTLVQLTESASSDSDSSSKQLKVVVPILETSSLDYDDEEEEEEELCESVTKNTTHCIPSNTSIQITVSPPCGGFQPYEKKKALPEKETVKETSRNGQSAHEEEVQNERKAGSSTASTLSSPVADLENQIQFYDRVERAFYLELDRNSFSLTPSSSSDANSPVSLRKRRSTSSEQKFFSSSLTTSRAQTPDPHMNMSSNITNATTDTAAASSMLG